MTKLRSQLCRILSAEVRDCFVEVWKFLSQYLLHHLVTGEPSVKTMDRALGVALNIEIIILISWLGVSGGRDKLSRIQFQNCILKIVL